MHIHCLGINHNTASIDLRERLAFSKERMEPALARLGCGRSKSPTSLQEIVILSTCNRVEIYAVASQIDFETIEIFLSETTCVGVEEFRDHIYRLIDGDAVYHLMKVASGLDSLVLGEPQILGQVTEALSASRSQGTTGKILSRLFESAIHTGKRARTETIISHNPVSIASVAVVMISKVVKDLESASIMVLGAGEMAELAVKSLMKRGAKNIIVMNRTLERGQTLANLWGGKAVTFESLAELLPDIDILIASTGAPHIILPKQMAEPLMRSRVNRPLVIMDIAVPRDVDPEVGELPGVSLFDIDNLSKGLVESVAKRKAEVPRVEAILRAEHNSFMQYLATLDILPIIVGLREHANSIRQLELEKTLRRFPDLGPESREQLDALTRSIVQKILHLPTLKLKEEANGPKSVDFANVTRALFGLNSTPPN